MSDPVKRYNLAEMTPEWLDHEYYRASDYSRVEAERDEALERNSELECDLDALRDAYADMMYMTNTAKLVAERDEARAALRKYGNHVLPCETARSPKLLKEYGLERWPCTCGFEALAAPGEPEGKP